MPTIRVGRRGQITIPKQVREALEISEGDRIAFVTKDGDIVLQPIRSSLRDHRGSVPAQGEQDFEAVRAAVRQTRAQRGLPAEDNPAEDEESDAE